MTNNCYQEDKERLRKKARGRYQNISEEEKNKRRKKARERYQIFTKVEKTKRCNKNLFWGTKAKASWV